MMKNLKIIIAPLWIAAFAAVACIKKGAIEEMPHPQVEYTYLHGIELGNMDYYNLDIDANGTVDFTFSTRLVDDPVLKQDKLQFLVGSKIETNLLNSSEDISLRLAKGDRIRARHKGYNWLELSSIVLAEKVSPQKGEIWWQGAWKDADHHFLPVQLSKGSKAYHGWIELGFSHSREKLILYKAGICKDSGTEIKAGF
jgi:hypothetical protein